MPVKHFSDPFLKTVRVEQRTEFFDDHRKGGQRGLILRVSPERSRTWYVRYTVGNRKRRYKIGVYPEKMLREARREACEVLRRVDRGDDPQAERETGRQAETFGELAEDYIEEYAKRRKRSWREDQRKLEQDILPHWSNLRIADISRADVKRLVKRVLDRGARVAAARTAALISRVFSYAQDEGLVQNHPAQRLQFGSAKSPSRDRVLAAGELRALWARLDREDPVIADVVRLLLLSGQRRGEVVRMTWDQLEGNWWTVPAEIAKNGREHRVFLSAAARFVLEQVRPRSCEGWVFTSSRKAGVHVHQDSINALCRRICAEENEIGYFTPHDLRRTVATELARGGVSRERIAQVLNHKGRASVIEIYDRYSYDREKRDTLETWSQRLMGIVVSDGQDGEDWLGRCRQFHEGASNVSVGAHSAWVFRDDGCAALDDEENRALR